MPESFDLLAMTVRRGMLLVFGGVLTGVAVAFVTRKVVTGMLTGISSADPGIMAESPPPGATLVGPMCALCEE